MPTFCHICTPSLHNIFGHVHIERFRVTCHMYIWCIKKTPIRDSKVEQSANHKSIYKKENPTLYIYNTRTQEQKSSNTLGRSTCIQFNLTADVFIMNARAFVNVAVHRSLSFFSPGFHFCTSSRFGDPLCLWRLIFARDCASNSPSPPPHPPPPFPIFPFLSERRVSENEGGFRRL